MPSLQHPVTNNLCTTPTMTDTAHSFYTTLFSPEPTNPTATSQLLDHITPDCQLTADQQSFLLLPFTIHDICDSVSRSPKASSPGPDGLLYPILFLVYAHPLYTTLITHLYNNALSLSLFPSSWMDTTMCLLPKKSDLTLFCNWCPLSLINCDTKVFIWMLNSRMVWVAKTLINPYQTGFLPSCFIADNGLMIKLAMEHASSSYSPIIGILCDQEKAYDHVHPSYLQSILTYFCFPPSLVTSIASLFFKTKICININGHLSDPVTQARGLRQGDPLSPVLLNFVLKLLLLAIQDDPLFRSHSIPYASPPLCLKVLAYADNILACPSTPSDLTCLCHHLDTYSLASNAHANLNKTHAFSLSSAPLPEWHEPLTRAVIPSWIDHSSPSPLIYLGYPLIHTPLQHNTYATQLLATIQQALHIHSQRFLSV